MSSSTSWARHRRLILCTLGLALLSGGGNFLRAQAPPQGAASAGENTTPVNTVPEKKQELRDEDDEYRHSPAVQKLGALIGLDPEQAATSFTVFNFLILLAGIAWLLLKTLPKAFRNRNSGIQKHLVDARTATEESAARLSSVEERLSKLDEQIAAMRGQVIGEGSDGGGIHASVEEEKAKILAAAEAEIQAATAMARREIQAYAADLAIDQAARKLVVSAETDRLLVESFAHRLLAGKGSEN